MRMVRQHLPEQIADVLRREIRADFKPGDALPPDRELIDRFGVSSLTLRQAMLILKAEGLIQRQQGGRTKVGRPAAASQKSDVARHVAVLINHDLSHPRTSFYLRRATQQARVLLQQRGIRNRLYVGYASPWESSEHQYAAEFLENVRRDRIAGVVAIAAPPAAEWIEPLRRRGVPLVGMNPAYDFGVRSNHAELICAGMRQLLERGRRHIAVLGWGDERSTPQVHKITVERLAGVLAEYGARLHPDWVRSDVHPAVVGAGWQQFREIWSASRRKPDGLLITDDMLYPDAAAAILDTRIEVPGQLMVVSHANVGSQMLTPFPTVLLSIDPADMAAELVRLMESLLQGQTPRKPVAQIGFEVIDPGIGVTAALGR